MYSNRLAVKVEILDSQKDGSTGRFYSCLERLITVGSPFRVGDGYTVIRLHSLDTPRKALLIQTCFHNHRSIKGVHSKQQQVDRQGDNFNDHVSSMETGVVTLGGRCGHMMDSDELVNILFSNNNTAIKTPWDMNGLSRTIYEIYLCR